METSPVTKPRSCRLKRSNINIFRTKSVPSLIRMETTTSLVTSCAQCFLIVSTEVVPPCSGVGAQNRHEVANIAVCL